MSAARRWWVLGDDERLASFVTIREAEKFIEVALYNDAKRYEVTLDDYAMMIPFRHYRIVADDDWLDRPFDPPKPKPKNAWERILDPEI